MTSAEAVSITPGSVTLADGRTLECGSVVVCSGFTLFDARLKEEYGYGFMTMFSLRPTSSGCSTKGM